MVLQRVERLQAAALRGWPAGLERTAPGGWILRATPGVDRGRSNHALTPCRVLEPGELDGAIDAVTAFAAELGIHAGIQVSPLGLHDGLERALGARGWERGGPVRVLAARAPLSAGEPTRTSASAGHTRPAGQAYHCADHPDSDWLRTWARCEPGRDVDAHARTVFAALSGRAQFGRLGDVAVGIAVPWDHTLGLYCLAVDPDQRRRGLGRAITVNLGAGAPGTTVFLQVEAGNVAANALYTGLGLREIYRYAHWRAPG